MGTISQCEERRRSRMLPASARTQCARHPGAGAHMPIPHMSRESSGLKHEVASDVDQKSKT